MSENNNAVQNAEKSDRVSNGIEVVLNGGNRLLESATVPYRWFFTDELIALQPTHLLVIDLSEREFESEYGGERKIVPIDRGSDFIQFTSPGAHRLIIIALKRSQNDSETQFRAELNKYVRRSSSRAYEKYVNPQKIGWGSYHPYFAASVFVEVEIPEEFFARRKKSALSRAIWSWTNRWFETPPRDQCAYRKRLIWALSVQPPLVVIGHLLKYIWALISTIYLPSARICAFLAGYRPVPIFRDLPQMWTWKWRYDEIDWDLTYYNTYRLWDIPDEGDRVYMPITFWEVFCTICIPALSVWSLWLGTHPSWAKNPEGGMCLALLMFLGSIVAGIFFVVKTRFIIRTNWFQKKFVLNEKVESRKEEKPFLYFEWLQQNTRMSQKPARVTMENLPVAFKGKTVQAARIKFWGIKRKVCKPFAKG